MWATQNVDVTWGCPLIHPCECVCYLLCLPCDEVPNCFAKERCQEGVKRGRLLQEGVQCFQQELFITQLIIDLSHITCQQLTCYIWIPTLQEESTKNLTVRQYKNKRAQEKLAKGNSNTDLHHKIPTKQIPLDTVDSIYIILVNTTTYLKRFISSTPAGGSVVIKRTSSCMQCSWHKNWRSLHIHNIEKQNKSTRRNNWKMEF